MTFVDLTVNLQAHVEHSAFAALVAAAWTRNFTLEAVSCTRPTLPFRKREAASTPLLITFSGPSRRAYPAVGAAPPALRICCQSKPHLATFTHSGICSRTTEAIRNSAARPPAATIPAFVAPLRGGDRKERSQ